MCQQPLHAEHAFELSARAESPPQQRSVNFLTELAEYTPRVWAMPLIVGLNVLVYAAMVATGVSPMEPDAQTMLDWGANFGPRTLDHQQWRMLTSAFLHFGIFHIGFNMWVLWQLGGLVERLVGNVGFLVLYTIAALGGSVASLLWNPLVVSAGASGAVFGVCGALLGFIVRRGDTIPMGVLSQLRGSMMSFLGYNLVFGLMISGINIACHIGGLVAGFACGLVMSQPLGPKMVAHRWKRNLACICAALLLSPMAMASLPASPSRQLDEIGRSEVEIIDRYESERKRNLGHPISDADWAEELDRDVLKPWQQLCSKVDTLAESRLVDKDVMKKYQAYFALRDRGWKTLVEGLRSNDKEKVAEFGQLWQQANELAAKLSHH